jgi:hypothetical protein
MIRPVLAHYSSSTPSVHRQYTGRKKLKKKLTGFGPVWKAGSAAKDAFDTKLAERG